MSKPNPKRKPSDESLVRISGDAADREQQLAALFQDKLRAKATEIARARGARIADGADYDSAYSSLLESDRSGRQKWPQALGSVVVFVAGGVCLPYGIAKSVQHGWTGGGVEICILAVFLGLLGIASRYI